MNWLRTALASARSKGRTVTFGSRELVVEEASPGTLSSGELELCFFSVGTATSRELVTQLLVVARGTGKRRALAGGTGTVPQPQHLLLLGRQGLRLLQRGLDLLGRHRRAATDLALHLRSLAVGT